MRRILYSQLSIFPNAPRSSFINCLRSDHFNCCNIPTKAMSTSRKTTRPRLSREGVGVWTASEHARFLEALELYPHGPWKLVAAYIGTRSTRQAMTHAQKYRQKLERRRRGLRNAQSKQLEPISQLLASETFENETIMLNFERLLAADEETWCCVEPIPLTIPHATDRAELEWIDDCFSYFVENFSC